MRATGTENRPHIAFQLLCPGGVALLRGARSRTVLPQWPKLGCPVRSVADFRRLCHKRPPRKTHSDRTFLSRTGGKKMGLRYFTHDRLGANFFTLTHRDAVAHAPPSNCCQQNWGRALPLPTLGQCAWVGQSRYCRYQYSGCLFSDLVRRTRSCTEVIAKLRRAGSRLVPCEQD